MGYPDGYYYGQGRIICDTSTFSVGDTIRVRSVYNVSQTEDKQVVTVGTPLIFTVPPYDYYKICRVQTINDTPTEVGGEYVEIGFGDLHRSNVLDKTTLGGIQGILNAHQGSTLLSVGDEVNVTIGGVQEPYILLNVTSIEAVFGWRYVSDTAYPMNDTYADRSGVNTYFDGLYESMSDNDKIYIKDRVMQYYGNGVLRTITKKIWNPTRQDICGDWSTYEPNNTQFSYFTTQINRVKTKKDGTSAGWQTATANSDTACYYIQSNGVVASTNWNNNTRVLPCFRLAADS